MLRLSVIFSFALWIGGLTFYALFVVPEGNEVFGSHTAQGFVTQRVTHTFNVLGVLSLAIFLYNWFRSRSLAGHSRITLPTWLGMAACQLALFPLHASLDALLDKQERMVIDKPEFYAGHRGYLLLTGVMWLCALLHLAGVLRDWQRADAVAPAVAPETARGGWKRRLLVAGGVVLALLFAGLLLPRHGKVERSTIIHGSQDTLYAQVADLRRWPHWSAWTVERFPDMQTQYSGPDLGAGAVMLVNGKTSGDGRVKIVRGNPAHGIEYELDFEHGTQFFNGAIRFEPEGSAVRVSWTLDTDLGANPLKRWGGLLMDALMGSDMAIGLHNLKQLLEKKP